MITSEAQLCIDLSTINKIREREKLEFNVTRKDSVAVDHSFALYLQRYVKRNVTHHNYIIVQFLDIHFACDACEKSAIFFHLR